MFSEIISEEFEEDVSQTIIDFSGIFLFKAEMEENFHEFYLELLKKFYSKTISSKDDFLTFLGNVGG